MIDVAIKTEKHFRIRIIKVGVNHFLLYHLHVLTIVPKSWTSLCELIHFISLLHLLHWVDTYGCGGWRSRMQWPKETNAIAEGVECGGWRSRMRWPKESNAVAGGDTFWTLITRDCCIILNWVHLKKSRIIFFVIVTYWQSMARFRKNDFFKWAQKIKSVFCFIPHTHEGCDVKTQLWALSKLTFQSTHPRRVWHRFGFGGVHDDWFQSTHPRRVWLDFITLNVNKPKFQSTHPRRVWLIIIGN